MKDDDAPDTEDAMLDDFTRAAEGLKDDGEEIVKLPARSEVVRKIQRRIADSLVGMLEEPEGVYHVEMLIAIMNVYVGFAEHLLHVCPLETFESNRQQSFHMFEVIKDYLSTLTPSVEQLGSASTGKTRH